MEDGFPVGKGAHMAENILQQPTGFLGILAYTGRIMGIRTNGHDPSAQVMETLDDRSFRQLTAAAIHTAGILFQTLSFCNQNFQDLIYDFLMIAVT